MTVPAHPARGWRPPARGADYIAILIGTELVVMLLGLLPGPAGWGPALGQFIVYVIGLVLGVARWAHYRSPARATGLVRLYLILALGLWALEAGRRVIGSESISPVFVTVALLLVLVWLRPPDAAAARWTIDALGVVLMGAIALSIVLEATGLGSSWYVLHGGMSLLEFDNGYYWLPLADILGLDGRWAGPFPHPNMAGPMGGFLLVLGMCRTGWLRWTAVATGALVLLLASSRTSLAAALVATVVVLIATLIWNRPSGIRGVLGLLAAPAVVGVIAAATAAVSTGVGVVGAPSDTSDPMGTFSGRTSIWPVYVRLWRESPWLGSPDARIAEAQAAGDLPGWAITAHNQLLDSLFRFGILGTALVVALFVVVLAMGIRAARRGSAVSLGTVTVVLVCGMAEVLVFWRLWAASTILLFLAVIAAMESGRVDPSARAPQPEPDPVPGTGPGPDPAPSA